MDREHGASRVEDTGTDDVVGVIPIKDIGFSVPFGIAARNVSGVAAKIRTGARLIDLQFSGANRSNPNAQTPELYGKDSRQALREMAQASGVEFTTHATFGVMGLAGMGEGGNFSKANKKFSVDEIKKAIEFAADVAQGGHITIHTGEFNRPISEEKWAWVADESQPGGKRYLFKNYKEEAEEAIYRIVDDRTGQIATQVRKNQRVARPMWLTAKEKDYKYKIRDDDGNVTEHTADPDEIVYIDYDGFKIKELVERVPQFDSDKGRFKVEYSDWAKFEKEAKERTNDARAFWEKNKDLPDDKKEEAYKKSPYFRFKDAPDKDKIEVKPEEAYIIATLETNAANSRGWAVYYGINFDKSIEQREKLLKAREVYAKIEEGVPDDEKWKLLQEVPGEFRGLVPPEYKTPTIIIDEQIKQLDRNITYSKESALSQQQQSEDTYETMRHVIAQEEYALKESFDSYAQAGMYAMDKSLKLEKDGKLKKDLFVAMEQIFPESYGGHPEELMRLVEGGRSKMAEQLRERGYNEEEALERAERHIKGHLDTGHINMWRKYWVHDSKISPTENEDKFQDWVRGQVEKLAEKHMIGSVHLTDNFGYADEHLSPGQGNTPIKDIVRILKKHDYNGPLIVEPGGDAITDLSDFHGLMRTWRYFGMPVYGSGGTGAAPPGPGRKWSEVQYSYFGNMQPPYFTFGRYSPSEDWTLWSGVPME